MNDVEFHSVTLARRWDEARDLVGLCVELGDAPLAASFQNPGQYVQVRLGPQLCGYFALASRPGEPAFELLVKPGGAVADALLALAPGDRFEMSSAAGAGFPAQHHTGKDVLLFAVGSGISPIRSLIWYLAAHREEYAGVTLFFGARTPEHFAYRNELDAWRAEGVEVVRVASQPTDEPGYVHGYVQDALRQHPLRPENTVVFVCGMKAMVEAVSAELQTLGVPGDSIFQNF